MIDLHVLRSARPWFVSSLIVSWGDSVQAVNVVQGAASGKSKGSDANMSLRMRFHGLANHNGVRARSVLGQKSSGTGSPKKTGPTLVRQGMICCKSGTGELGELLGERAIRGLNVFVF